MKASFSKLSPLLVLYCIAGCSAEDSVTENNHSVDKQSAPTVSYTGRPVIDPSQHPDKQFLVDYTPNDFPIDQPHDYCNPTQVEIKKYKEDGIDVEETITYYGPKIDQDILVKFTEDELNYVGYYFQQFEGNLTNEPERELFPLKVAVQNYSLDEIAQVDFTYYFKNVGTEAKATTGEKIYKWTACRTLFLNLNYGMYGPLLPCGISDRMPAGVVKFPRNEWYPFSLYTFDRIAVYRRKKPLPITDTQSLLSSFGKEEDLDKAVELMVKNPEYWNLKPKFGGGTTPQMVAYLTGNSGLMKLADENGADVHSKNLFGMTYMHFGAQAWGGKALASLVERGVELTPRDWLGRTPFHYAAAVPITQNIDSLVRLGADINSVDKRGMTPTSEASLLFNATSVDYLVKNGGNINNVYLSGGEPLFAVIGGNPVMAKTFLQLGYPVETRDLMTGGSLLVEAGRMGNIDRIELLLDAGANPKTKDAQGQDFISAFKKNNHPLAFQSLLEFLENRKSK